MTLKKREGVFKKGSTDPLKWVEKYPIDVLIKHRGIIAIYEYKGCKGNLVALFDSDIGTNNPIWQKWLTNDERIRKKQIILNELEKLFLLNEVRDRNNPVWM